MPAVVVGTQWGRRGKGKATDQLGQDVDYVVKFNGRQQRPRTIPSSSTVRSSPSTSCWPITPRVTPSSSVTASSSTWEVLLSSTRSLEITPPRGKDFLSLISANAHYHPPSYNRVLDRTTERFLGVSWAPPWEGPTYADKMNRVGIRVQDLFLDESIPASEGALRLHPWKNSLFLKAQPLPSMPTPLPTPAAVMRIVRPMVVDCPRRPTTLRARPSCSRPASHDARLWHPVPFSSPPLQPSSWRRLHGYRRGAHPDHLGRRSP